MCGTNEDYLLFRTSLNMTNLMQESQTRCPKSLCFKNVVIRQKDFDGAGCVLDRVG